MDDELLAKDVVDVVVESKKPVVVVAARTHRGSAPLSACEVVFV